MHDKEKNSCGAGIGIGASEPASPERSDPYD